MFDISVTENVTLCTVSADNMTQISYILFLFAENDINIDMISAVLPQGHRKSFSFSFSDSDCDKAFNIIKRLKEEKYNSLPAMSIGNTKLLISGDMESRCGIASVVISTVSKLDILMITTAINEISLLIPKADELQAIEKIKKL